MSFLNGFLCVFKGVREILTDFRIFLYTIFPILLGTSIMFVIFYYGWDYSSEYLKKSLLSYVGAWVNSSHWLYKSIFWILNIIIKALLSLIMLCLGFVFIQIVSIPFYSLICERILLKRNVFPQREF